MSSCLTYDNALSQLTEVRPDPAALTAGHPATQYEYAYDSDGWRSEKRSYTSGTATRVRYLYYGNDLLAEVKVTLNNDEEKTVDTSTLSRGYHWMSGRVGEAWRLLSVQDYERVTVALPGYDERGTVALPGHDERVTTALPGYDGRGNIVTWTNGATGELIGTADYGPYGERFDVRWVTPADEASYDRFGFGTEYRDETGLIFYGARYYSPALGRFLSRDPAGVAGSGVNLYAFCGGDPVNNREFYGLCNGGGFWGWVGSFFSGLRGAITGAVTWLGNQFEYKSADKPADPSVGSKPSAYDAVHDAVTGRNGPNKIWTELLYEAPKNSHTLSHAYETAMNGYARAIMKFINALTDAIVDRSVSDILAEEANKLYADLLTRIQNWNEGFFANGNSEYDRMVTMLQIMRDAQVIADIGRTVAALMREMSEGQASDDNGNTGARSNSNYLALYYGNGGLWHFEEQNYGEQESDNNAEIMSLAEKLTLAFANVVASNTLTNAVGRADAAYGRLMNGLSRSASSATGVPIRALTQADLGINGKLINLRGTFSVTDGVATVRIDMIEGQISNPFQVINSLSKLGLANGASTLRIEATLANERLYNILVGRYGMTSQGAVDSIIIKLK
jgi:RHS repeat-associated protein